MEMDGWDSAWAWGEVSLYTSRSWEKKSIPGVSVVEREVSGFGSEE